MNSTREKASYCIGLEAGKSIKNQFSEMDLALLSEGFQDALAGKNPKLPGEEIVKTMTALKQQMERQQKEFVAKLSEENLKRAEAFFAENKNQPGVITLPSGLQYQVLSSGTGATPTALDVVSVHYKGFFIDGRVFDSSYERGQPQTFPVNRVIPGWVEALKQMKVGDKWKLFIPPYLAYGEMGFGNEIEPNMTLIFEMELLSIN